MGRCTLFTQTKLIDDTAYSAVIIDPLLLGIIPGRDQDTVGAGMARVLLNFGGTGRESAIECFYKMHLSDHVMIQPDLQYIASPSGLYRDALVAGVRFELVL